MLMMLETCWRLHTWPLALLLETVDIASLPGNMRVHVCIADDNLKCQYV